MQLKSMNITFFKQIVSLLMPTCTVHNFQLSVVAANSACLLLHPDLDPICSHGMAAAVVLMGLELQPA